MLLALYAIFSLQLCMSLGCWSLASFLGDQAKSREPTPQMFSFAGTLGGRVVRLIEEGTITLHGMMGRLYIFPSRRLCEGESWPSKRHWGKKIFRRGAQRKNYVWEGRPRRNTLSDHVSLSHHQPRMLGLNVPALNSICLCYEKCFRFWSGYI